MKLTKTINFLVGDWSGDGHQQEDTQSINCNLSAKQIKLAYKRGIKIIGFDLSEDVCCEYEDNKLSLEKYDRLINLGMPKEFIWEINLENYIFAEDGIGLYPEDFVNIYLFIVELGNPDFSWERKPIEDTIEIGGYGLFS